MTVLSYKHNRFNTATSQVNWQKSCPKGKRERLFSLSNFIILFTIILGAVCYVVWCANTTNQRIDIQQLEKKIQTLEEKNSELKTAFGHLNTPTNISGLAVKASLAKQDQPTYLSIKNTSAPLGFNSTVSAKNE